ncbi:MAG: hypothetical protein C0596_06165 [Marinilabiliales bacterium]|nr:MAG: hypothetical protein C0596_06165 [Marinilabiliales bacterium]
MKRYRINKNTSNNPNGNNEVHNEDCYFYSRILSYEDLGLHVNCQSAVAEAKRRCYVRADGCKTCSPTCHRG